jgi:hypothetical protein
MGATILERSRQLKQDLTDFVLDAEGELAEALEAYAAANARKDRYDPVQQEIVIDTFITEGKVGDKTPIDLFIDSNPELTKSDRQLLNRWKQSFIGLFTVTKILPDGLELMNWLTAKHYIVKPNDEKTLQEISRFKQGEILLTRIAPVTDTDWIFSCAYTPMGKLGKPKLAVAIGNFKDNYRSHLYSDAPDLLAEAWQSVATYHQQFIDFFGTEEITMPGYQLNKKVAEFQELLTQQRLKAAGVDGSKSLSELAEEAGVGNEELEAAAKEAGADSQSISELLADKSKTKMVAPKVELPAELKKAEQVTAISHPRWGQMFLPTYTKFVALLETEDWRSQEGAEKLVRYYLENASINTFIWKKLAQQYPKQVEKVVREVLERPQFKLERDLETLLQEYNKPIEPELPEIASVPIHLHNLFEEAFVEVNKSSAKNKGSSKKKTGFGFKK